MKRWNQSNFETGSLGMGEIFRVSKLIRFQHCDPAGIVFYPQYFVLFHEVMEDWFYSGLELKFADLIVGKRLGAPTVDIRGQFFAPSRLGETLEFSLLVRKIGASSIGLELAASAGEEVRVQIEQTLVLFSFDAGRTIPVPDDLRESMLRFYCAKG
jgi:4-hydroxybenzoyl-CoA thioesterase